MIIMQGIPIEKAQAATGICDNVIRGIDTSDSFRTSTSQRAALPHDNRGTAGS
jgi:hypothetical protein